MAKHRNSDSWDSDGNLIVPRYGIRIAMAVALLAAGAFQFFTFLGDRQWHKHNPEALPTRPETLRMLVLWVAFPLVPFILAGLLLSRPSEESKAAGAGIAAALFTSGLVFAIALFVGQFMRLSPDPYVNEILIAILMFLVCSVWVIVSGLRIAAKASWGPFFLSAAAGLVCMVVAGHLLDNTDRELDRQYEQQTAQANLTSAQINQDAHQILARLAGCLIEYHATHPGAGFPPSLDALPHDLQLPGGTACNVTIAGEGAVPNYRFTYTAVRDSSGSTLTDFRLVAMPLRKGLPHVDPIAVDSRGRIFSYIGWSGTDRQPAFVPRLVETPDDLQLSKMDSLRAAIRSFVQDKGGGLPASLADLGWVPGKADAENQTLLEDQYKLSYFPRSAGTSTLYTASSVCQSYGEACLRSFYLDEAGEVHQTSEPRQPTAHDPLIPDCEKYAQTCRDINWPLP